jgi:hypothetical protein
MPTIEQLNQRRPGWNGERHADLHALYAGGEEFKERLHRFLLKREHETTGRYELRKAEAVYRNYVGPIVNYFTALLFGSKVVLTASLEDEKVDDPGDFYNAFRDDCDGAGSDLDAFLKDRLTHAMVGGRSWIRLNAPRDTGATPPGTKAEYDQRGLGDCWLTAVDCNNVLDWGEDELGRLAWVVTYDYSCPRMGLGGVRDVVTETWQYFTTTAVDTYRISYPLQQKPGKETDVPFINSAPHKFARVPLVPIDLTAKSLIGLWVLNTLETPQLAHFRLSNAQTWGMTATCYAMAVFHVGEDDEGEYKKPAMGAGLGIVMGIEETVDWLAPPSAPYAALSVEISGHKDEIYRIAHQMALGVENNAAAIGRSAESKASDAEATRTVLLAYARVVKEVIEFVYDLIATVRGDKYGWNSEGLDDFAAQDLPGLCDMLAKIDLAGGINSPTWHKRVQQRLAESSMPDLSAKDKSDIRDEIEGGVEQEQELDAATKQAVLAGQQAKANGTPPPPNAAGIPGAKGAKPGAPAAPANPPQPGALGVPSPTAPVAGAVPIHQTNATSTGIAQTVYEQLAEDFPPDAIEWVRAAVWQGPIDVPLDSIDTSNSDTWAAADEPDRVSFFDGEISDGTVKPIVLVNEPNNEKLIVADGHHRVMAALEQKAKTIPGYVAHVTTVNGPWDTMHASQKNNDSGPS